MHNLLATFPDLSETFGTPRRPVQPPREALTPTGEHRRVIRIDR